MKHSLLLSLLGMCIVGFAGTQSAFAVFNYTSQDRHVAVSDTSPVLSVRKQAADFGPFSAEASDSVVGIPVPPLATQNSTLAPYFFSADGVLQTSDSTAADAQSFFDIRFTVDRPQLVQLTGNLDPGSGFTTIQLDFTGQLDLSGARFDIFNASAGPFDQQLYLPIPTEYHFQVYSDASGSDAGGRFSIQLSTNTPPVAPLPPAIWAGLATLGGIVAFQYHLKKKGSRKQDTVAFVD
jgi:hypothetical protein